MEICIAAMLDGLAMSYRSSSVHLHFYLNVKNKNTQKGKQQP